MSVKYTIKDFSKGMQPSQRSVERGSASLIKNFDIATDNQKLIPVPTFESWVTNTEKDIGIVCLGATTQGSTNIVAVGKSLRTWFATDWKSRISIKPIKSSDILAIDYAMIDLSLFPDTFWDVVDIEGKDIRVTDDENESLGYFLTKFDKTLKQGRLMFKGVKAEVFVYFNAQDKTSSAKWFDVLGGEVVDYAWTLDGDVNDYAHTSPNSTNPMNDGAIYTEADLPGIIGKGYGGVGTLQTDIDDGRINMGDDANVSFLIKISQAPAAQTLFMSDGNGTMNLYLNTNGTLRQLSDTDSGSIDITGTTDVTDGEWHYISYGYNEHSQEGAIWIDGNVDASITSGFGNLDNDNGGAYRVKNPVASGSTIEMVTLRVGQHKTLNQHQIEARMLLQGDSFWNIGATVGVETIDLEYKGAQLWQKDLKDSHWKEFEINGKPVKTELLQATPTFLIYSSGYWYTIVNNNPNGEIGELSTFAYISKLGYGEIDWTENFIHTSEGYPRAIYAVDKKYYINASSISMIDGGTFTEQIFDAYSTVNHLAPYGQRIAIVSDRGNQSYLEIKHLDPNRLTLAFANFGAGRIRAIGTLGGAIFGIINNSLDNELLANGKQSLDIRIWQGGSDATPFLSFTSPKTLETDETNDYNQPVLNDIQYIKNGFVFYAKIYDGDGELQQGLWSVTKNAKNGVFAVSLLHDTSSIGDVYQIFRTGSVLFVVDRKGGVFKLSSDDYSTESVWQSTWIPGTDISGDDQVMSFEATFEPLDENQEIKLEYQLLNGDWVTVFTHKGKGTIKREAKMVEPSENLPSFQEIQVRLTSKNGKAPITSISATIDNLLDE